MLILTSGREEEVYTGRGGERFEVEILEARRTPWSRVESVDAQQQMGTPSTMPAAGGWKRRQVLRVREGQTAVACATGDFALQAALSLSLAESHSREQHTP